MMSPKAAAIAFGLLLAAHVPAHAQGFGYGGYGGFGGGYGQGFGGGGYGGPFGGAGGLQGSYPAFGYAGYYGLGAYSNAYGLGGVGYPGIAAHNPYFGFGLSPLAVQNAAFERTVLGRGLPGSRTVPMTPAAPAARPVAAPGAVGTGTFSLPR